MKHRSALIGFLLAFLALGWPTLAAMRQVGELFAEARYEEARQALPTAGESVRPGEDILWQCRLATDPSQTVDLLRNGLEDSAVPESTRVGMGLQLAQIYFARGQYKQAHAVLDPLVKETSGNLPGEIYLLSGLTYRQAGQIQQSREMLASVKPTDQAFGVARYFLGDIGLENNDAELALRYFESGQQNAREFSHLKAGQWRALRAMGKDKDAESLLEELRRDSPGCLALVEIGRVIQEDEDDNSARLASASSPQTTPVKVTPENTSGRYALQIGAFSDRGRALEFKRRYQKQIPGLQITEIRDSRGQYLYKLRFGSYINPALARSEAMQQENKLNLEVIVVELGISDRKKR